MQVEPKQGERGSLSRDQIAGFVPGEGEDRENWSEEQELNVLCLKFGLVNTTSAYRDLLCARHWLPGLRAARAPARGFQGSTGPSLGAGVGAHEGFPTSQRQVQGCAPSVGEAEAEARAGAEGLATSQLNFRLLHPSLRASLSSSIQRGRRQTYLAGL